MAPAGVDPQLDVIEPMDLAVERVDHELYLFVVFAVSVRHEMERRLLDLDAPATGITQRQQFLVHGLCHIPDDLALVLVLGRVYIQEERHHLRAARAELYRLAGLPLPHPPQFLLLEPPLLDLLPNIPPSPAALKPLLYPPCR